MPLFELMSGAALAVAAILLILPGFATDILGFLIIFPLTRKLIFKLVTKKKKNEDEVYIKDDLIEGEFVDKDNENDKKL